MTGDEAEEFTQALGQVVAGGWRVAALGERLGVPKALGLTTREWVSDRLGGYLKLSIAERKRAVAELTDEGMTQRTVADVLGVAQKTVDRDLESNDSASTQKSSNGAPRAESNDSHKKRPLASTNDLPSNTETVCPTCQGTGRVLLREVSVT